MDQGSITSTILECFNLEKDLNSTTFAMEIKPLSQFTNLILLFSLNAPLRSLRLRTHLS
jgi:hypothetical protein